MRDFDLRVGKHIQVGINFFKCIGQQKNPDADQEKAAHESNDPHMPSYFIKGGKEEIKGKRGKEKRNSKADGIVTQEHDPFGRHF